MPFVGPQAQTYNLPGLLKFDSFKRMDGEKMLSKLAGT